MLIPISHLHVKIIQREKHGGRWFALMQNHYGEQVWIQQPHKPKIGDEQIIYIIRGDSEESDTLTQMLEAEASVEEVERFIETTAKKYGVFCQKTFAEAETSENDIEPSRN